MRTLLQAARELEQQVVTDANDIMQAAGKEHVSFLDARFEESDKTGANSFAKLQSLAADIAALKAKHGIV